MSDELLDAKKVTKKTTLAVSTIYKLMAKDEFPRPIRLGPQIVRWKEAEVDEWINNRPRA